MNDESETKGTKGKVESRQETKELCCVFSVSLLITSLVSLKPKGKKSLARKRGADSVEVEVTFPQGCSGFLCSGIQ